MTNEEAWAAGFLDGEGSFRIACRTGMQTHWMAEVVCGQNVPEPLDRLQGLFGGRLYIANTSYGPQHKWFLMRRAEIEFCLRTIEPLVTVKRAQVLLLLEFLSVGRGDRARKLELFDQMRTLNRVRTKIPA